MNKAHKAKHGGKGKGKFGTNVQPFIPAKHVMDAMTGLLTIGLLIDHSGLRDAELTLSPTLLAAAAVFKINDNGTEKSHCLLPVTLLDVKLPGVG